MKRIISAILCVVMLLCILPMSVFAQDKATPLILVQGYSGPSLFYDLGGENEHQVWGINMDDLKKIVIARIPELAGGLAVGYWKDRDEIAQNREIEKIFTPKMEKSHRDELYKGWKRAVERSRDWAKD